jgi:uncharacterized protein (TIGR03382 family)
MHRSSWLPALLLLAGGTASAHVPHDPAYWVALSPDQSTPWAVTSMPVAVRQTQLLVRTLDRQDVDLRFVIGDDEGVGGAAMLGAERLVLGTVGRGLWTSDDVGDSFTVHPDVPADATLHQVVGSPDLASDGVALATGFVDAGGPLGTIWRTADAGDSWVEVASLPGVIPWDISFSPLFGVDGRAFMVSRDGELFGSDDGGGTWLEIGGVPGATHELAVGAGGRIWLATDSQGLWRSDDNGESFEAVGYADKPVVTVAEFAGDLVMFCLNDEAVYVSSDGGDSFELRADAIEDASPGQPASGVHYYELRQAADGAIWLASWEGLVRSEDGGQSWQHVETYLPEAVRDIGLTYDAANQPAVMASAFGGGGYIADPLERAADPMGFDLAEPYFKRVATSHDYGRDEMAAYYLLTWLMVSTDADDSWERYAQPEMGDFWDLAVAPNYSARPTIMAAGNIDVGGGWCVSQDDGGSWSCNAPRQSANFCSAIHISDGFDDDGLAWTSCGESGELWVTSDHGDSWVELATMGIPVWGLAGAPGGEKLFIATHQGLYVSTDGGQPGLVAFDGQSVWDVAVSPSWSQGQELFVLVPQDGWYRSVDGGDSFELLDAPTLDPSMTVALSPDYARDRAVAIGGFDGTWYSADGGDSWEYAHALELITDFDPLWSFDDDWAQEPEPAAINETRQVSAVPGARATLRFRGVGVDLIAATSSEGGELSLVLDGLDQGSVSLQGDDEHRAAVWSIRELDDAWHELEVSVASGVGVVDSALVWRLDYEQGIPDRGDPDDTGETDTPDDTSGDTGGTIPPRRCDCASGGGGAGWGLLALAAALIQRRRRGVRP